MKVLVIDNNTEGQAFIAAKIQEFPTSDIELLDLRLKLTGKEDYMERVIGADVILLGPGLEAEAAAIARNAKSANPSLHVMMFVSDHSYSGGMFRSAHLFGIRKVFPISVKSLDVLQELIGIHTSFRREGRTTDGKVIAVAHVKGGVGATSITAALGEVCSSFGKKTLLWDLDIESRDLCRALMVNGAQSAVVNGWISGELEINRQTFRDAQFAISNEASVLMPPNRLREGLDLACHVDGATLAQRIVDLARITNDVMLIDTAGRMGPAIGTIFRVADSVLVIVDDSTLGLTAVDYFLTAAREMIGGLDKLSFICSGDQISAKQIATELTTAHKLSSSSWRLPAVPYDQKAGNWPGQGKTLYSLGNRQTQLALTEIAEGLGLISRTAEQKALDVQPAVATSSLAARMNSSRGVLGKMYNSFFQN